MKVKDMNSGFGFRLLLRLYPRAFREQFADQMLADLEDLVADAALRNAWQKMRVITNEIRGLLFGVVDQYLQDYVKMFARFIYRMREWLNIPGEDKMHKSGNWMLAEKKEAVLACLPPLLIGASFSLTWMIIGGKWYEASQFQLRFGLAVGLILAGVVAVGGLYALSKRFLAWGFSWLGADIVGLLLLLSGLAEDRQYLVSKALDFTILGAAMAFTAVVLVAAALRAWQAAGLVSIGMSTTMALSNVHLIAIPPINRADLAVLGLVFGFVFSILTWFFTRSRKSIQMLILALIGAINLGIIWLASHVWSEYWIDSEKLSPFIPFAVFMLVMLLAGPVAGLFRKPLNRLLARFAPK